MVAAMSIWNLLEIVETREKPKVSQSKGERSQICKFLRNEVKVNEDIRSGTGFQEYLCVINQAMSSMTLNG